MGERQKVSVMLGIRKWKTYAVSQQRTIRLDHNKGALTHLVVDVMLVDCTKLSFKGLCLARCVASGES